MYWNSCSLQHPADGSQINRNMRCIEMICCHLHICHRLWLIETWDVLKYGWKHQIFIIVVKINRNMRCIEMRIGRRGSCGSCVWLIETWDVLKCSAMRAYCIFCVSINRNMRCIEMTEKPVELLEALLD